MADNLLMPEGSDSYYGQKYMPSQSMSAYQPTWRDRLGQWLMGDERSSPERNRLMEGLVGSRGLGETGPSAIDFTPAGIPLGVNDAWHKGDDRSLAMALIPGAPKGVGAVENAAAKGIRAYHGSPHDFDKFDISKIGTGEGAQAYGHGLYFAEREGVAKSYREALRKTTVDGNPFSSRTPEGVASGAEHLYGGDVEKARKYLQDNIDFAGHPQELRDLHKQALELINAKGFPKTVREPGHMYEVRLNADPDHFLDWDKPLSQQSEKVQRIVSKFGDDVTSGDPLGKDILQSKIPFSLRYDHGIKGMSHDKLGALALREAGIPGARYLDAGSRTAGEGSRNYVVFDPEIISIVRKYGIAAAASMYGLDAVNQAMGAAQDQPQNLLMQGY